MRRPARLEKPFSRGYYIQNFFIGKKIRNKEKRKSKNELYSKTIEFNLVCGQNFPNFIIKTRRLFFFFN